MEHLFRVRGTVQGVGFRPFVARRATALGLRGWVLNDGEGILVRAQGEPAALDALAIELRESAPRAAHVTAVERLPADPQLAAVDELFQILESTPTAGPVSTNVSPDLAPCPECTRELLASECRRFGYPFINCTQCGPRYSIIESLPYDRERTTMRSFAMCPECAQEYHQPANRRFHAEPNACQRCGPQIALVSNQGIVLERDGAALDAAVAALRSGAIVAVKGVGGFHLFADAQNETAVAALRARKGRDEKPLAVMFRDLEMLRKFAAVSALAEKPLVSPARPIVLVPSLGALAPSVAPKNPWLGALLPSSPLHLQLLGRLGRPAVATSANHSEEPLCSDLAEARDRLCGIADLFLNHNRRIANPCDDSVLRITAAGAEIMLRRARGSAPAPFQLPRQCERPTICLGAQMKNTVSLASDRRLIVSPHLGDLEGAATVDYFARTIQSLQTLFGTSAEQFVCDKHPDYASTRFAHATGRPVVEVQHHLAHVLAVLLEHEQGPHDILGVAWDGTGWGEDGTIWGGEFILLRKGRASRFARFRPFSLPGAEAGVRDCRRVALSLATELNTDLGALAQRFDMSPAQAGTIQTMMVRGINSPRCGSVGRLFDGVGALLGLGQKNTFEGRTAMQVEIAASNAIATERHALPFPFGVAPENAELELDWRPAMAEILAASPASAATQCAAFHRGLAQAITTIAQQSGVSTVALSGGCFQNALLRDLAEGALRDAGFNVLAPRRLPPNDGAISAGQALGALWNLTTVDLPAARQTT
jgi:hydrogenase maturation protein HypF